MEGQRRFFVDCREYKTDPQCTLYISGTEEEVVQVAALHSAFRHGMQDTPELREQLRSSLREEEAGARSGGVPQTSAEEEAGLEI